MIEIVPTDPLSAEALHLIAQSEAELSALYPPEDRYALSPAELADQSVQFFTAWTEGEAIGCCGYAREVNYAEIKRLFVQVAHRGTGVAAKLLSHVEAAAHVDGYTLMRLETGRNSPAAVSLYTRAGYQPCAAFGSYPENAASVFMEKTLAPRFD